MTVKGSVYIATSLDGFIARPNGEIDWLTSSDASSGSEDYGYQAFIDTVDVIVMGRHTFEQALTFESWPYSQHKVVVLSSQGTTIPDQLADNVELLALTPREVMRHLAEQGAAHAYVDGGNTIQRFLRAGLIHELTITRIPILLGAGIPLFGAVPSDITLKHVETRQFANGFVQSRYRLPTSP